MRLIIRASVLSFLFALPAMAHPSVGIVMDSRGRVFYSDLARVWMIDEQGRRTVAVPDVHTHELSIEPDDAIHGEDNEFLGGDRYRHRIWKRTAGGALSWLTPWRDGVWPSFGFVTDGEGARYWIECPGGDCRIRRRTARGVTSTLEVGGRLRHRINWMASGRDGSLYIVHGGDVLRRDRNGTVATVARGLGAHPMGLYVDSTGGDVYVAVYDKRAIVRIGRDGRQQTVARTPAPWGPSGVVVAPDGSMWILEFSTSNQARVRRISRDGRVKTF